MQSWLATCAAIYGLAACQPTSRTDEAGADAGNDAPGIDDRWIPIAVTGLTPLGPLGAFRFAHAAYDFCTGEFELVLATHPAYDLEPRVQIHIPMPETAPAPVTGPQPATLAGLQWETGYGWRFIGTTTDATFDAAPLDAPGLPTARMIGTVRSTAPGWNLAFDIDLAFVLWNEHHGGCTI